MTKRKPRTKQQEFDFVYKAIVKQGRASASDTSGCMYRHTYFALGADQPTTDKCAIGMFIPDRKYNRNMEGMTIGNVIMTFAELPETAFERQAQIEWYHALQQAHDHSAHSEPNDFVAAYTKEMRAVAERYDLNDSITERETSK